MLVLAIAAGLVIGISLGALGGGGSILAVPVLVYLLGQTPVAATTGSLVIVGLSAVAGAVAAWRKGNMLLARGAVFGIIAIGGATLGARWSTQINQDVLLAAFSVLMLLVAVVMVARQSRSRSGTDQEARTGFDAPIVQVSPTFLCDCPRAAKIVVTATAVGLLTGFFGVGGGFLAVPALVLALQMPMVKAAGTSLVVISLTSAAAFTVRMGAGVHLDWAAVAALTGTAVVGGIIGVRLAGHVKPRTLGWAFSLLVLTVAGYTAWQALPALVA